MAKDTADCTEIDFSYELPERGIKCDYKKQINLV